MANGSGPAGQTLLIRANGGAAIGAGHVMRCLALAQAWRAGGGRPHFRLGGGSPGLESRLTAEGMEFTRAGEIPGSREDGGATAELAARLQATAVATDGYAFAGGFQEILKAGGARLLVIDDNGECSPYSADLILNQNPHAHAGMYRRRPPACGLLLGCRYAMLREEFLSRALVPGKRAPGGPRNVLVTMGGGDPDNATLKAVRALQSIPAPGLEAKVVVGMVNPNLASLEAAVAEGPAGGITLIKDAREMPDLMAWADLALSAAGSTLWELLHQGVPTAMIRVAENQQGIASILGESGAALDLGWHARLAPDGIARGLARLLHEPDLRAAMTAKGMAMVDGGGARRVALALSGGDPA